LQTNKAPPRLERTHDHHHWEVEGYSKVTMACGGIVRDAYCPALISVKLHAVSLVFMTTVTSCWEGVMNDTVSRAAPTGVKPVSSEPMRTLPGSTYLDRCPM
jgi:hypothetical protein